MLRIWWAFPSISIGKNLKIKIGLPKNSHKRGGRDSQLRVSAVKLFFGMTAWGVAEGIAERVVPTSLPVIVTRWKDEAFLTLKIGGNLDSLA